MGVSENAVPYFPARPWCSHARGACAGERRLHGMGRPDGGILGESSPENHPEPTAPTGMNGDFMAFYGI